MRYDSTWVAASKFCRQGSVMFSGASSKCIATISCAQTSSGTAKIHSSSLVLQKKSANKSIRYEVSTASGKNLCEIRRRISVKNPTKAECRETKNNEMGLCSLNS